MGSNNLCTHIFCGRGAFSFRIAVKVAAVFFPLTSAVTVQSELLVVAPNIRTPDFTLVLENRKSYEQIIRVYRKTFNQFMLQILVT